MEENKSLLEKIIKRFNLRNETQLMLIEEEAGEFFRIILYRDGLNPHNYGLIYTLPAPTNKDAAYFDFICHLTQGKMESVALTTPE